MDGNLALCIKITYVYILGKIISQTHLQRGDVTDEFALCISVYNGKRLETTTCLPLRGQLVNRGQTGDALFTAIGKNETTKSLDLPLLLSSETV